MANNYWLFTWHLSTLLYSNMLRVLDHLMVLWSLVELCWACSSCLQVKSTFKFIFLPYACWFMACWMKMVCTKVCSILPPPTQQWLTESNITRSWLSVIEQQFKNVGQSDSYLHYARPNIRIGSKLELTISLSPPPTLLFSLHLLFRKSTKSCSPLPPEY